jgi:hypothetical protein
MPITILASFALTKISAVNSLLIAFTIFLLTIALLAVATSKMSLLVV